MARKFLYVPLTEGSLNLRGHYRETTPPAIVGGKNFYYSSSDLALTIRPDIEATQESHVGAANGITGSATDKEDYINSAHGIYGTSAVVYFSSICPYTSNYVTTNQSNVSFLWSIDASPSGTVNVTNGSATVTGNSTTLLEDYWPGCLISFGESTTLYRIIDIVSDTELTLNTTYAGATATTSEFTVYRTHQWYNRDYKLNVQAFTSNLVYACPTITDEFNSKMICGPFYSSVGIDPATPAQSGWRTVLLAGTQTPPTLIPGVGWKNCFITDSASIISGSPNIFIPSGGNFTAQTTYGGEFITVEQDLATMTVRSITPVNAPLTTDRVIMLNAITHPDGSHIWISTMRSTNTGVYSFYLYRTTDYDTYNEYSSPVITTTNFDAVKPQTYSFGNYGGVALVGGATPRLVVGGVSTAGGSPYYQIIYSDDADAAATAAADSTWTRVTLEDNATTNVLDLCASRNSDHGDSKLIGIALYGSDAKTYLIYSSNGGATWTKATSAIANGTVSYARITFDDNYDRFLVQMRYGGAELNYAIDYVSSAYAINSPVALTFNGVTGSTQYCIAGYFTSPDDEYIRMHFRSNPTFHRGDSNPLGELITWGANDYCTIVGAGGCIDDSSNNVIVGIGKDNPVATSTTWSILKYEPYSDPGTPGSPEPYVHDFIPLSNIYRANTFSSIEGYIIIGNTIEWEADGDGNYSWQNYPRRIRWTDAGTVATFDASHAADLSGTGSILDMRTVGNKVIVFESSQIGTITPRGYPEDPWEYDVIRENIRLLSNPIVVGRGDTSACFFIANDGLLYSTNGITVDAVQSGFDATIFEDFDFSKPIWLDYSEEMNSILSFYPQSSGTSQMMYTINIETGAVGSIQLLDQVNTTGGISSNPKSICCIQHSDDKRTLIGYQKDVDIQNLAVGQFDTDTSSTITGTDTVQTSYLGSLVANTKADIKWHTEVETGIIQPENELSKFMLHDIILNVYNDGGTYTGMKYGVYVKSIEDSDWSVIYRNSDSYSITTNGVVTGTAGTSNFVYSTSYRTGAMVGLGTGSSASYTSPWLYEQGAYYSQHPGTSDFAPLTTTKTGNNTFTANATSSHRVWVFSMSAPFTEVEANDVIKFNYEIGEYTVPGDTYLPISSVTNSAAAQTATPYPLATASSTAILHTEAAGATGEVEITYPINKLVTMPRFKIVCVPTYSGPITSKILGFTLVYTPAGERKLS